MESTAKSSVGPVQVAGRYLFGLIVGVEIGWMWWVALLSLNITRWYSKKIEQDCPAWFDRFVTFHNQFHPMKHAANNWGFRTAMCLWFGLYGAFFYTAIF